MEESVNNHIMYLHDIDPFGKGGRGRRNSVFNKFKHDRNLAERMFHYGRPCTFEPVDYWQTVNIFNPCRYCGKTSECNYSKDNRYLVCKNVRGDVEVPGGGFLHVLKNSVPPPLQVPANSRSWLDESLEQTEPDIFAQDPLGDSDALLETTDYWVDHCGELSLVFEKRVAGELKLVPTYCGDYICCGKCGGEWRRQFGSYFSQVWAAYPHLHFHVAVDIKQEEAITLLQHVATGLNRRPEKPQYLASVGPKFLVIIAEAAFKGSTEISPRQALGLLADLALRPGSRTRLWGSIHGAWWWPKEAIADEDGYEKVSFWADEASLLAAKSAIHEHFGAALGTVSKDQVDDFFNQWCRSQGWGVTARKQDD